MTRFEKLKEMTIEEIAEWWWDNIDCRVCSARKICDTHSEKGTLEAANPCSVPIKEYLNSEVEPENEVCASCAIDYPQEEISAEQIIGEEEKNESKTGA